MFFIFVFAFQSVSAQQERKGEQNEKCSNCSDCPYGKVKSAPKPKYPAKARKSKVEGKVQVMVCVDESGNVLFAKAVYGHNLLRKASEKAALSAKFEPAKMGNTFIKFRALITYDFSR